MVKVLFVCLGNICRSPTAHAVFENMVEQQGLASKIRVDSAGTAAWHIGKKPDSRSMAAASRRGVAMQHLRARQATAQDFDEFDYVLAMDESNLSNLQAIQPAGFEGTLDLFLAYGSYPGYREVPDPYYGGDEGFDIVLDLVESAAEGLLSHIREQHGF